MNVAKVVVEAVVEGEAAFHGTHTIRFCKNDRGILYWLPHATEVGFWQPLVVWDKDTARRKTVVQLEDVRVVGMEADSRFLLQD